MYLTRMPLNSRRRGCLTLLASPQRMHAAVLAGFARSIATDQGRVLWRVDRVDHHTYLYVASPFEPDFTHLVEEAGWPTTETWLTRPYEPLLRSLVRGQTWGFRLRANTVHSVRTSPGDQNTRRQGHVTVKHQEHWLLERARRSGFTIPDGPDGAALVLRERDVVRFRRGDSPVTLSTATFEGRLVIDEADAFRRSLTHGIGRAKSYGCGLLTIAPLTSVDS